MPVSARFERPRQQRLERGKIRGGEVSFDRRIGDAFLQLSRLRDIGDGFDKQIGTPLLGS